MNRRQRRVRGSALVIAITTLALVAAAPVFAASPTWGSGGFGSGGVLDDNVLALFEFGVDNDVLNLDRLAWWSGVASEPEADPNNPDCLYSGSTADNAELSYIDLGRSLVIRVEGATASCGAVIYAEIEVLYRDRGLATSAIVDEDCDGGLRRGVLRTSESAVASVYLETEAGLIIEATGDSGSAGYSFEQFVCVDATRGG